MNLNLHKINNYLFYTFIFLIPWHTIYIVREVFYGSEKWQYGTIGIYLSDISLFLWIILSIYLYKDKIFEYITQNQKLIILAIILSLWSFLSIFWATDKMLAFYFALKLSIIIDLFFLIQIVPLKIKTISIILIISAFLQSILGLLQFITQQTFSQKFLGLNTYDVWHGGTAIINTDTERWLRIYGGFPHPNIFAGFMLCALLVSLYLYLEEKQNLYKFILLLISSFFTANILLTFSRTIWITTLLCIFFIIIYIYKNKKYKLKQVLPFSLVTASTIILLFVFYQSIFSIRTSQDSTLTHNSITDRTLYINQSKNLFQESPLLGTGVGNYTNTLHTLSQNTNPIWQTQPVHNVYLLIISELGLIGIIIFTSFIFYILYNIYLQRKNINLSQFMFILLFISFLFISLFDHWPWTSHFGLLSFFILAGLSLKKI
ncbi:MAG: O-antigen ligase family protein [Candidatus Moraniibacteriota bacterium]|jgi:O-antigen ligase